MGETMRNDHDNLRHYRYAREHDRYKTASWPEPAWRSLLKIAGTIVGAVGLVGVFWILTVGIFLI